MNNLRIDTIKTERFSDVEDLLMSICERECSIQLGRKAAFLESRFVAQAFHHKLSAEKVDIMHQKKTLFCEALSGICQIASAKFGDAPFAKVLMGVGHVWSTIGGQAERFSKADEEKVNHLYQTVSQQLSENGSSRQSAEQAYQQAMSRMSQILQNSIRSAQNILGA